MSYKYLLLLVFMLLPFAGCENNLEEAEFPFEFKLVIRGILEEGQPIKNIYIGRTMPIQDSIAPVFSRLTDATVGVMVDDQFLRLNHTTNGLYENLSIIVQRNKTYTLIASWEDKTATAVTYIPLPGTIGSPEVKPVLRDNTTYYKIETSITPMGDEAYAAVWQLLNATGQNVIGEGKSSGPVIKRRSTAELSFRVATDEFSGYSSNTRIGVRLYVYDGAFYDYYMTQNPNQVTDLTFGQPQAGVKWNVSGDGIGMFIGRTVLEIR
ncbi:MAG: DUF4249 family protein [Ignavibacteriaceae bacterium]|nr:DUF4249 family protein [Ignavibacteriaceae bacterium]